MTEYRGNGAKEDNEGNLVGISTTSGTFFGTSHDTQMSTAEEIVLNDKLSFIKYMDLFSEIQNNESNGSNIVKEMFTLLR